MTRFAAGASFKNKMAGFMPDAVDFGSIGARNIGVQKTLEGNQLVKDAEVQYTRDLAEAGIATNETDLAASNAQSSANAFNTILSGVASGIGGGINAFARGGGFNGNAQRGIVSPNPTDISGINTSFGLDSNRFNPRAFNGSVPLSFIPS